MIQLYGIPRSSSARCEIVLEEIGVPYEFIHTQPHNPPEAFIALNPGRKVPFLVDGGVKLFESMAINHYLAAKYKPELSGQSIEETALIDQWSFWTISNFQPGALDIFLHTQMLPEDKRDARKVEAGKKSSRRYLAQLEGALVGDYLVGGRFTIADINVGSVTAWLGTMTPELIADFPKVRAHSDRLRERPSFIRAYSRTS
jgi:glutathione S-transferase